MSSYDVYNIVSQFGRVKCMRKARRSHSNGSSVTVPRYVITLSPRTPKLKQLCKRVAYNFRLTLKWADDDTGNRIDAVDTPNLARLSRYLSQMPVESNSPSHMLNVLPDDCLRAIFTMNTLDVNDLLALALTCWRFRNVAIDVFEHNLKSDPTGLRRGDLRTVHEFFHIFGSSLKTLNLLDYTNDDTDVLLRIVIQCCPNLKIFSYVLHERQSAKYLRPLLKNLTKLTTSGQTTHIDALFEPNAHYELQTWNLKCTNTLFPNTQLINLVHLELDSCESAASHQMLEVFCLRNPQIRHLTIKKSKLDSSIGSLVQHLPNLETLDVESNTYSVYPHVNLNAFGQLQQLKVLSIKRDIICRDSISMNHILKLLVENDIHVEHLTLESVAKTPMIFFMKWLKYLRMDCLDDDELTRLSTHLPHLTTIEAMNGWMSYTGIRNFVLQSKSVRRAIFEIRIPIFCLQKMEIEEIGQIQNERQLDLSVDFAVYTDEVDDSVMQELEVSLRGFLHFFRFMPIFSDFFHFFSPYSNYSSFSSIS